MQCKFAIFLWQLKFPRDAITTKWLFIKKQFKTTKNYNTLPIYTIVNLTLEKCNVFFYYISVQKTTHRIFIKSPSKYPHMQLYISLSVSLTNSLSLSRYIHIFHATPNRPIQ